MLGVNFIRRGPAARLSSTPELLNARPMPPLMESRAGGSARTLRPAASGPPAFRRRQEDRAIFAGIVQYLYLPG